MRFDQEDLDAIRQIVREELQAAPEGDTKPEPKKPAAKKAAAKPKVEDDASTAADNKGPSQKAVLEKAKILAAKDRQGVIGVVNKFATEFSKVKGEDLAALDAALDEFAKTLNDDPSI